VEEVKEGGRSLDRFGHGSQGEEEGEDGEKVWENEKKSDFSYFYKGSKGILVNFHMDTCHGMRKNVVSHPCKLRDQDMWHTCMKRVVGEWHISAYV